MRISIIVATDLGGVIGKDGDLPWRLPADLAHFKRVTMGKPILMGRKTWESIGRPLPGRTNIVLTRNPDFQAEGVRVVHDVDEARRLAETEGAEELMIIGGAEIYAMFLPHADRLYLTRVDTRIEGGDAHFPPWDHHQFTELDRLSRPADDRNPHDLLFLTYERT